MLKRIIVPEELLTGIFSLDRSYISFYLRDFCKYKSKEISTQNLLFWAGQFRETILSNNEPILFEVQKKTSDDVLRYIYACISCGLGDLNNAYGHFFEVRDRGMDFRTENIPVSKTNSETGFHTDSTSKDYCPKMVGLLCLQNSEFGGESLLASAEKLWDHLNNNSPNLISELTKPTIRDVITRNEDDTQRSIENNAIPIFEKTSDGIRFRYMRYWIERAHEKTGKNIPKDLMNAMDEIDRFFHDQRNVLEFKMNRGEMLFINNEKMAHNRKEFQDSEVQRVLVRTWID